MHMLSLIPKQTITKKIWGSDIVTKWKTQRKLFKVKVIQGNLFQKAIHTNQAKKLQSKQNYYLHPKYEIV